MAKNTGLPVVGVKAADLAIGMKVEWLYETRKGWGYRYWVPAEVLKVCRSRIRIAACLAAGGSKIINVKPESLRFPKEANK